MTAAAGIPRSRADCCRLQASASVASGNARCAEALKLWRRKGMPAAAPPRMAHAGVARPHPMILWARGQVATAPRARIGDLGAGATGGRGVWRPPPGSRRPGKDTIVPTLPLPSPARPTSASPCLVSCKGAPSTRPSARRLRGEGRTRQKVTTADCLPPTRRADLEREGPPRPLSRCAVSPRSPPHGARGGPSSCPSRCRNTTMPAAAGRRTCADPCSGRAAPPRGAAAARPQKPLGGLHDGIGTGPHGGPAAPPPAPDGGRRVAH